MIPALKGFGFLLSIHFTTSRKEEDEFSVRENGGIQRYSGEISKN